MEGADDLCNSTLVVDNLNDFATFFLQSHRSADSQGVHGTWGNCEAMEAEDTSSANIRGYFFTLWFFLPYHLAVNDKSNSANNAFRLYSRQRSSRRGLNLLTGRNLSSASISKIRANFSFLQLWNHVMTFDQIFVFLTVVY
jgi:hypothetical protein